jgi:uncharacterized protein YdeI (YjbR/CyaY-like superfamily)
VPDDKVTLLFADATVFATWLDANQAEHPGVWMRIAKRGAPEPSVSYEDALEVALAYGWIDGQKRSLDDHYWLQAFTRRRPRSVWSRRNVDKATSMISAGTMKPAGLAEVAAARADGRWDRAYAGSAAATPSPEFLDALELNPEAKAFYETLNSVNRFALYYRIHSAKTDATRQRRIATFVDMLSRGETLH